MNLENKDEFNYIKLDFSNKNKLKNESDIKEENLDFKTVIESFEQQITLEELNSFIYKLIPKNINDLFKINIEQTKKYKKEFPFTKQSMINSVNRILATDFKSNFAFNRQNLEDVSRILCHIFESLKKYNVKSQKTLEEKIKTIKLNINDIFNMFIDLEMMHEKKNKRSSLIITNQIKSKFFSKKNRKCFNSTGHLTKVKEKSNEENSENYNDQSSSKSKGSKGTKKSIKSKGVRKSLFNAIYSSNSDSNNNSFDSTGSKNKNKEEKKKLSKKNTIIFIDNNDSNKLRISDVNTFIEDQKIILTKEYFIYPENNYGLEYKKLELPIELIILLKKFEAIKILTFQIRDADQKLLKENLIILFNMNLLFPNFIEIKIDLNDEKLQQKINNIYEMRGKDLMNKFKKDLRIFLFNKEYQSRTTNCWEPEGDIIFINEKKDEKDKTSKFTCFGNNYILGENAFENSNFFGNNLKNLIKSKNISEKLTLIKYIMPIKGKNNNFLNSGPINEFGDDEIEDFSSRTLINMRANTEYQKYEKNKALKSSLKNKNNLEQTINISKTANINTDVKVGKKKRKRTTPELLDLYIKDNKEPYEMIIIYCWFLVNISKIKTLSLYFYDSFSLETEFFLRKEEIKFEGFHFLFFINKLKELKEVNFSFNSLDTRSFENILGLIELNKNISKLRINFFTPDISFNSTSLLKLCSILKLSLHNMFKEQIISYIYENDLKDLDIEYFILNHKLDFFFAKNICCLFNIIKKNININNYEEIVFRFDLPSLILSCEKYLIIIIKFFINMINLITFTNNKISNFKLISPELILDGRITPILIYLFKELSLDINNDNIINENKELDSNKSLKIITLQCKIFGIPNLFNICLYNNISGLTNITIGDLDLESFNGFINDYKNNLDKMINLITLKIGLNNTVISYKNVEDKIKLFITIKSINLKEKVLFSYLELDDIDNINDLKLCVNHSKIDKMVIQIGQNSKILLDVSDHNDEKKYNMELQSLFFIFTKHPYNVLIKDNIINNMRKFFKKNNEKIVICKP